MRKVVAVSGGVISTFWLFVFMASLVSTKIIRDPTIAKPAIEDFFPVKVDEAIKLPRPQLPVKKDPKDFPKTDIGGISQLPKNATPNAPVIPVGPEPLTKIGPLHPPVINARTLNTGDTASTEGQSSFAVPVAQIPPMYPRELAQQGIQGWVKLRFVVNEQGEPINIVVIDANPKSVFNRAALTSIAKWRYRPAMVEGKSVVSSPQEIVLEFKLESEQ